MRRETIEWSKGAGYEGHVWDGDRDPIAEIFRAVMRREWVAVSSATGIGKTFAGACLLLYWLRRFRGNGRVVTIAPKHDQLALHLWAEVGRLFPAFGMGTLQALRLRMEEGNDIWGAVGFVAGVSAQEAKQSASKAQGFHGENMLVIIEETPGVHEAVMAAFENTATAPNNVLVAFGNPNSQTDTLARFGGMPHVRLIRASAYDHPNVVSGRADVVKGAQTKEGLARLRGKYGSEEHPMFLSRARGIPPAQATDALIRWDWLVAASEREVVEDGPGAMGVDVANSEAGDEAAIVRGKGGRILDIAAFPCPNANRLGERVVMEARALGIRGEYIGVDSVGVGAGTVNECERLGMRIRALNGGEKAAVIYENGRIQTDTFLNLRSQMLWALREDLRNGEIAMPFDEEAFVDLTTPRWIEQSDKSVRVESKDEIKKRLGRSPNKGDAIVYWNWVRKARTGRGAIASIGSPPVPPATRPQPILERLPGDQGVPVSPFRRSRWFER